MLLEILEQIEDPRSYHGKEYRLHHILFFTIIAILHKSKTYADVHRFLVVHFETLNRIFHLKWRRVPDESALRRIILETPPE